MDKSNLDRADVVLSKNADGSITKAATIKELVTREQLAAGLKSAQEYHDQAQAELDQALAAIDMIQVQLDSYDSLIKSSIRELGRI